MAKSGAGVTGKSNGKRAAMQMGNGSKGQGSLNSSPNQFKKGGKVEDHSDTMKKGGELYGQYRIQRNIRQV